MVGRKYERHELERVFKAKEAQFLAVYGRRRVGKTRLIREFFEGKKCRMMQATGLQKGTMKEQLANFTESLSAAFTLGVPIEPPSTWMDAYKLLTTFLSNVPRKDRVAVFLDEFPWMATPRSRLLEATDYYWNHHWSRLNNVILVICGSSASWIIRNIINDTGGLHNRTTGRIRLEPFNLAETAEFLARKKVHLNHRQTLCLYMALGGIPYYLNYVQPDLSAEQNIQHILFARKAPLRDEFEQLFASLFKNAAAYIQLVTLIGEKREGMRRAELAKKASLSRGGGFLTDRLEDLVAAGFIREIVPWERTHGEYYKLIDPFSLFYLRWMKPAEKQQLDSGYWTRQADTPAYWAWAGYAFETVCWQHVDQILAALRIPGGSTVSSWRHISRQGAGPGAQIDLLIDRPDDAITVCEVKYTEKPFRIDKVYAANLLNKVDVFKRHTGTSKQIFIAMLCASGLTESLYSEDLISAQATLEDLFQRDRSHG